MRLTLKLSRYFVRIGTHSQQTSRKGRPSRLTRARRHAIRNTHPWLDSRIDPQTPGGVERLDFIREIVKRDTLSGRYGGRV